MALTRVRWTRTAHRDLIAIGEYIAADNPIVARMVVNRLHQAGERLVEFPERGRVGRVKGTRELVIPQLPFIIIYRRVPDGIELLTVVHGAQQYPPER